MLFYDEHYKITHYMKKLAKAIWIIVGILFLLVVLIISLADKSNNENDNVKTQNKSNWTTMSYEEKTVFLEDLIKSKKINNANDIDLSVRESIKKEIRNPKTVKFEWTPSIYNGSSRVVEADSAWIYTTFKCYAKNDFGVEKEIMGSVTYKYNPQTNNLNVHKWDINQNN